MKKRLKSKKKMIVAFLSLVLGIVLVTPFYITAKAEDYYCAYAGGTGSTKASTLIKCDKNYKTTITNSEGTQLNYIAGPFLENSSEYNKYASVNKNTNTTNTSGDTAIDDDVLQALYGTDWESHTDMIPSFDLFDPINSGAACIGWSVFKIVMKTSGVCTNFFNFDENAGLTWAGLVPIPSFQNSVMKGFVYLLSWISQIMLAIGIILSIGEETIRYGNGQGNFASTVMNIIKAIGFTVAFVIFGCTMFQVANRLGYQGALAIMQGDANTFTGNTNVTNVIGEALSAAGLLYGAGSSILALGSGGLIILAIAILIIVLWVKAVFFYMKKIPQMVAMLGKGAILPFFVARGQTQAVTSYLQQLGMFYLQIVLQFAFLAFGMNIMGGGANGTESVLTSVFLGAIMILSIDEIDRWIGGIAGEDDLNKAVSFLHHASLPNVVNGTAGTFKHIGSSLSARSGAGIVGAAGDAI